MDRIVYVLACLIAAGLSGCLGEVDAPAGAQGDEFPMHVIRMDDSGCAAYVCVADPSNEKAQDLLEKYGYAQLTDDESAPAQGFIRVDGDWVVWVGRHGSTRGPGDEFARNDLFAMHVPSWEVYGVSVGPGDAVRPFLHDGRVVYHYSSANFTGLVSWELGASHAYRLDFPLQGRYWLWNIHGPWIATSVGTANLTKEYAWNSETDELLLLFEEEPHNDTTQFHNLEINGEAAYFVHRTGFGTLNHTNRLHSVSLADGTHRSIEVAIEYGLLAVGPREVILTSIPEFTLYDPADGSMEDTGIQVDYGDGSSGECAGPRIGGPVVLFSCQPDDKVWRLYSFANHTHWDVPNLEGGRTVSVGAGVDDQHIVEYWYSRGQADLFMAPL